MEDLPDKWTFFWQVIFCTIVEDTYFHFSHKLLHHRKVYPRIHKIHHMYKTTISIASMNSHWLEYFIGNLGPVSAGPFLLAYFTTIHNHTASMWFLMRLCESLDAHSGYEFPWSPFRLIPFSVSASYHDYHHSHNIGCYSTFFTFWDTLFGNNKAF
jgi:sterol desaturase/sphingolipid hydroxylase (fatty acid hydroxylase superfamily)